MPEFGHLSIIAAASLSASLTLVFIGIKFLKHQRMADDKTYKFSAATPSTHQRRQKPSFPGIVCSLPIHNVK